MPNNSKKHSRHQQIGRLYHFLEAMRRLYPEYSTIRIFYQVLFAHGIRRHAIAVWHHAGYNGSGQSHLRRFASRIIRWLVQPDAASGTTWAASIRPARYRAIQSQRA